jgi:hypothetical protein
VVDFEELPTGQEPPLDYGPNGSAVVELIGRARRLTDAEAHALAGAVAWQWQPLALPGRGSVVAARTEALAAARIAGRAGAAAVAEQQARRAVSEAPGGLWTAGRRGWAANGVAGVLVGVSGAIVCASTGLLVPGAGFAFVAGVGVAVLLLVESASVARRRLAAGVEGAVLAIVVRDLVPPETSETLGGPWSAVMRD